MELWPPVIRFQKSDTNVKSALLLDFPTAWWVFPIAGMARCSELGDTPKPVDVEDDAPEALVDAIARTGGEQQQPRLSVQYG